MFEKSLPLVGWNARSAVYGDKGWLKPMTISEVSEKYGLTAVTLRYYEKIGLIPPVTRNKSGVRDYQPEECGWVEFVKCMRSAGMPV